MQTGFSKIDITPTLTADDVHNLGYWNQRAIRFTAIRDRIFVRAATLGTGPDRCFLFSVESIFDSYGFCPRTTARLAAEFSITPDRIWISCTHAHSTPLIGLNRTQLGAAYGKTIEEALLTAARNAVANQREMTASISTSHVPGVLYNRRPILKNNRVAELHTTPNPADIIDPGPINNTQTVIQFRDASGGLAGAWWHFPIHGVCLQCSNQISGDCMGQAMQQIETEIGNDTVVLFLNGACGDIDPARMGAVDDLHHISDALKAALAPLLRQPGHPIDFSSIHCITQTFPAHRRPSKGRARRSATAAPQNTLPSSPTAAASQAHHSGPGYEEFLLSEEQALAQLPPTLSIPWQIWRLGDVILLGVAGELFTESARHIADTLRPAHALTLGYTGGWLGYFPPQTAFAQGGYETAPATWSPLAPNETEKLLAELLKQIPR